jgi:hypothetical protein
MAADEKKKNYQHRSILVPKMLHPINGDFGENSADFGQFSAIWDDFNVDSGQMSAHFEEGDNRYGIDWFGILFGIHHSKSIDRSGLRIKINQ